MKMYAGMEKDVYYHVPAWMSMVIHCLTKTDKEEGAIVRLKNSGQKESGEYIFRVNYDDKTVEEFGREPWLDVWCIPPDKIQEAVYPMLLSDPKLLIETAEDYAKERAGKEATRLHSSIVEMVISKAVKLMAPQLVTIRGDYRAIGRLPENGRLRVEGNVHTVIGPVGSMLEVAGDHPQYVHDDVVSTKQSDGSWVFKNCITFYCDISRKYPPG